MTIVMQKSRLILITILCSVFINSLQAQPASRPKSIILQKLQANHDVVFRIKAPNAKEVSVMGQWTKDSLRLTRDVDGVWSGIASAVPSGIWEYSFNVDGVIMLDPANPEIKPTREPRVSILHISDSPPQVWDFQDVPHGTVHQHSYFSKVLKREREAYVYTPPDYEVETGKKFPLLVLQHGHGDNQITWVVHGKANWILDNLIAVGKARPMIVVMLDGHPLGELERTNRAPATEAFRRELFEDVLPLVERDYRVEKDANHRGIVGLSMGGEQALTVGLGNLNRFAWIGSFSGVPPEGAVVNLVLKNASDTNAKLRLLWLACGKDDFLFTNNVAFTAKLKADGINYQFHITEGNHSWPVWRKYLSDLLPLLFQPQTP